MAIPLQDVFRGIGPFFVADVLTVAVLLACPVAAAKDGLGSISQDRH